MDESLGVYLHVPFCERVCPYCDFAVVAARSSRPSDEERYVAALLARARRRGAGFAGRRLASVYFGGGTPALLRPDVDRAPRAAVRARCSRGRAPEVTLEANPSTLERERLPAFARPASTRLSLGVQCFDDGVLHRLGRAHRAEAARAALRGRARRGLREPVAST